MSIERPDMESAPEFRSYDDALDELTELSKEKRVIFGIDEYPYLAKTKPAISAQLQHMGRLQDVPDPLWFVYEFYGESGTWQGKSAVWSANWTA